MYVTSLANDCTAATISGQCVNRIVRNWADVRSIRSTLTPVRFPCVSMDPNRYEVSEPELLRGLRLS